MSIQFYNSLSHRVEELAPINPGKIGMYTCGPTVYNFAHIGNFRCYAFEDILKRTLMASGLKVRHVMNLTDVDDKTIRGSQAEKLPLQEFTRKYKDAFFADIKTLRMVPANVYPAATETIPEMIQLIQTLFDKGIAYQAEDKSVYFSIEKWPAYGQLVKIDRDAMRVGVRIKMDEYAKDAMADFALWKAWDEADGDVWWDSPWGKGRPGWHIECSAMSSKYLGKTFDLHCGGVDNMFPHHEDEIAQSEAANGCKFVNLWMHCAHLMVEGQKMSKSLGNFYTLKDILAKGYSGREIRYVLIGTYYRQSLNFSFQALDEARGNLQRLDAFTSRLADVAKNGASGAVTAEQQAAFDAARDAFLAALQNDLNVSAGLGVLFDFLRDCNRELDGGKFTAEAARAAQAVLAKMDEILAVLEPDPSELQIPAEVQALADERQAARAAKDWAKADAMRKALDELGWVVKDTPKGPQLLKK
ncbi:MAG: cysteine--tRNA ligase [Lentisphaeria bacterium]|nr:cysteine--tRNA ligase [Lentisphaeria bacterium]